MRFKKRESKTFKFLDGEIIKKIVSKANGEGFYLVLFICFCVVAAAAVWTVKANVARIEKINDYENMELAQNNAEDEIQTADKNEDIRPVIQEEEMNSDDYQKDSSTEKSEDRAEPKQEEKVVSTPIALSYPVDGDICMDYSEESLVYSKTLDQYIAHKGIDIEAPLNTPVSAAADGSIIKVEQDKQMGITIWIQHANDLVTIYSNLSTTEMVNVGDQVKKGDVISGIGDTALFETLEVPHLHFEVTRNGRHENPKSHLDK